jgi:hypothetical protein
MLSWYTTYGIRTLYDLKGIAGMFVLQEILRWMFYDGFGYKRTYYMYVETLPRFCILSFQICVYLYKTGNSIQS